MTIPDVLPDIAAEIHKEMQKEIQLVEPKSNWASSLGHPCARYGVHRRLDWKQKPLHDTTTQMVFNLGKVIEKHIAKDYLERTGYTVLEHDRPISAEKSGMITRLQIGGKIDFICRDDRKDRNPGFAFPVEVKSMMPYDWERINTIEDLLFSKKTWHKTYPGQLTLYLLGKDYEVGCFLMINKATGAPKFIWVHLDYTYAEELVQRAEIINKHVAAKTYPERIPYDDQICGKCDYAKICLGDIVRTEAEILNNDDLIAKLEQREKLKPAVKEYEELDSEVKKDLQGIKKGVAGDFVILGKEVNRKGYAVEDKTFWQVGIKKL